MSKRENFTIDYLDSIEDQLSIKVLLHSFVQMWLGWEFE